MKRLFLGSIVSLFAASAAFAAPAYGTRMPQKNRFFIGEQTQYIVNRDLEGANGSLQSLQNFFLLSYGVTDWLSLDLKGGAGDIRHTDASVDSLKYAAFMGGGYGFRLRLHEGPEKIVKVTAGFQHISIHPHTRMKGATKYKAVLDDWQGSLLASYDLTWARPYAGTRISRCDLIQWKNGDRNRIKSDDDNNVGLIAGVDIPLGRNLWINCEGSWLDSTSVSAGVVYVF